MEILNILGDNHSENPNRFREACRGVVIQDGDILLTYEVNTDQWFIPGGGVENGESPEACCVREMAEETGYLVKPYTQFLTINEYYDEWHFVSNYFLCEVIGKTTIKLTQREIEVGLEARWLPLNEAITVFSKYRDYSDINEMKSGSYLREYKALCKFVEKN